MGHGMKISFPVRVMEEIHAHAEDLYPEEGAGLILGTVERERRNAKQVLPLSNRFEPGERSHRYRLDPMELLQAEELADQLGLEIIGVFHSHPDHPPAPSQYDLEWAAPWYVYLITSVIQGSASETRAWSVVEDHSQMVEHVLEIEEGER